MPKKIVLDTNFLMVPYKFKVDVFTELEKLVPESYNLITMSGTLDELRNLKTPAAKVGLELLNAHKDKIQIVESTGHVDSAIIEFSCRDTKDTIVCTNDKELKQKLKKRRVSIISLKNKSKIDFE